MILPDVNTLVYAYRREADHHDDYAAWLAGIVDGGDELGLVDHCLTGVIRIVTNPRIVADPAPTTHALAFVERLRGARRARRLSSTAATWATLASMIADDPGIRANLVPDAYLASLAITHRCRLATADRGFGRFAALDYFDPVGG
ncbi:MAG: TA system VapC family ribonuclease toxin [Acidimicrobiales bacterium]